MDLVRALARQTPDRGIAAILNRAGMSTGKGKSWTRSRVASLRGHNEIAVYREGERAERGEATLEEAAEALSVSPATVRRLIADSVLPARQHCKGEPYVIRKADLERLEAVNEATSRRKRSSLRPPSEDQQTLPLEFQ